MLQPLLTKPRSDFKHNPKMDHGRVWVSSSATSSNQKEHWAYIVVYVHHKPTNLTSRLTPTTQLSAALLRQLTYSTTRFGVYEELKEVFQTSTSQPSFPALVAMASTSGFLGGVAGNPADILNVRMQNDASLPAAERRNYKHALDGLARMVREEGLGSLFRGVWPNSTRAVLMTASQLASYDIFKKELLERAKMHDNLYTHFTASFMAGFVATTVCSPVDVIKTRVMSAKTRESIWTLVAQITQKEGLMWVFKGWVPSFVRLGPHTIATFMFLEQHKKVYRRWKGYPEPEHR